MRMLKNKIILHYTYTMEMKKEINGNAPGSRFGSEQFL